MAQPDVHCTTRDNTRLHRRLSSLSVPMFDSKVMQKFFLGDLWLVVIWDPYRQASANAMHTQLAHGLLFACAAENSPASFLLRVTDPPSIAHCARHLRVQTAFHQGTSREATGFGK